MKRHFLAPILSVIVLLGSEAGLASDGQIPVQNGKLCWDNKCLRVDAGSGRMQLFGRKATRIPSGIDLSDGAVTVAEFQRMFQAASLSSAHGAGRR